MSIKLIDIARQDRDLKEDILRKISTLIDSGSFILGEEVEQFERRFAAASEVPHAVACANGTDAIVIALLALGIGPGDEVITVPNTFFATAEAVVTVGARPVFVDVQKETLLMDPAQIETAVTEKTRAIIPVHLHGQPVDIDEVMAIAQAHDLRVIFDCAQAHIARYKDRPVTAFGDCCTFSFFPGKNLGAYGDGGGITTGDHMLADEMRVITNHGRKPGNKHDHFRSGLNSRLDTLQAAILNVKLQHLRTWTFQRRQIAAWYREELAGIAGIDIPDEKNDRLHVYHMFVIRAQERDGLHEYLHKQGIQTGIHYPVPLHLQPAFAWLGYTPGMLPVAEEAAESILSLPTDPLLTREDISLIGACIRQFYGAR